MDAARLKRRNVGEWIKDVETTANAAVRPLQEELRQPIDCRRDLQPTADTT
jgi:hypothetical protein